MFRSALYPLAAALVITSTVPVFAADRTEAPVAPSAAVAAAWAREAQQKGPSPTAFNVAYGSFGALTTLDMISTVAARQNGAREVNPLMSGSYGSAAAVKAACAAGTFAGVKALEKKSRKAAFITMVAVNAATAVVAVNNFRNAQRLR
jgi:hypothetical protein